MLKSSTKLIILQRPVLFSDDIIIEKKIAQIRKKKKVNSTKPKKKKRKREQVHTQILFFVFLFILFN